jgi:hypothetical protein
MSGVCPFAAPFDQSEVVPPPVFAVVAVAGDSDGIAGTALSGITRRGRANEG